MLFYWAVIIRWILKVQLGKLWVQHMGTQHPQTIYNNFHFVQKVVWKISGNVKLRLRVIRLHPCNSCFFSKGRKMFALFYKDFPVTVQSFPPPPDTARSKRNFLVFFVWMRSWQLHFKFELLTGYFGENRVKIIKSKSKTFQACTKSLYLLISTYTAFPPPCTSCRGTECLCS